MKLQNKIRGNAVVEFALMIPFLFFTVAGAGDLINLAIARVSLQKNCRDAVRIYARKGLLPHDLNLEAQIDSEDLPSPISHLPSRANRKLELVHLHVRKDVSLRFPILRSVLGRSKIPLTAASTTLRVTYE